MDRWATEEEVANTSAQRELMDAGGSSAAHLPGAWAGAASPGAAAEGRPGSGGAGTGRSEGWEPHLSRLASGAACGAVAELERVYAAMVAALGAAERRVQASAHAITALRADVARLAASP